jgi:hypothetical protein
MGSTRFFPYYGAEGIILGEDEYETLYKNRRHAWTCQPG